jgi:ankyrin repeat protein
LNVRTSPFALNVAVCYGNRQIINLLIQNGANPEIKNKAGKSSFDLLQKPEQNDIEEILRSYRDVDRNRPRVGPALVGATITNMNDLLENLPSLPFRRVLTDPKVTTS